MVLNLIAAVDAKTGGIGSKGMIPWKNKDDMKWFREMTTGNAVIMGWTTFVSLGKPLKDRLNIVITGSHDAETHYGECDNVKTARSIEESIEIAKNAGYDIAFVMGGESIYRQFLEKDLIDTAYIDEITNEVVHEYDVMFPYDALYDFNHIWVTDECGKSTDTNFYMCMHRQRTADKNTPDHIYLETLKDIMANGIRKDTRAGKAISTFGHMLRFDMSKGLPVLTTKKMYLKGCICELLWFLQGGTNIRYLLEHNTHIWDDDAYRHYLDIVAHFNMVNGLKGDDALKADNKDMFLLKVMNYEEIWVNGKLYTYGDLGPIYGKQWTDWYGHNQIADLVGTLKNNPDDRRMIVNAWNVNDIDNMALPPCHYSFQCYTTKLTFEERKKIHLTSKYAEEYDDNERMEHVMDVCRIPTHRLSLMWNQRSVDTCLGLPYNIMSYGLLLEMLAQVTDMIPGELICTLGDTHIYENQIAQAKKQLERNPYLYESPKVYLNPTVTNIFNFDCDDFVIENYKSYPTLKYELSVGKSISDSK